MSFSNDFRTASPVVLIALDVEMGGEEEPVDAHKASQCFRSRNSNHLFSSIKVNAFYLQKEAEFKVRLDALLDKRKRVQSRNRGRNPASEWESLREALVQFSVELDRLQVRLIIPWSGLTDIPESAHTCLQIQLSKKRNTC